jgi:G3E family GTPase
MYLQFCRGDFVKVLGTLCINKDKFDYIIVETTGLADPTFCSVFEEQEFKKHLFLDGIIVRKKQC